MEPEIREAVDRVKARLQDASNVYQRIAAYNSEGVTAGILALDELGWDIDNPETLGATPNGVNVRESVLKGFDQRYAERQIENGRES